MCVEKQFEYVYFQVWYIWSHLLSKTSFKGLAILYSMIRSVLIHIQFNIVHRFLPWQIAQTLMRRRVVRRLIWVYTILNAPFSNALTTFPQLFAYIEFLASYAPDCVG